MKNIDVPFSMVVNFLHEMIEKFEGILVKISTKYRQILNGLVERSAKTRAIIINAVKSEFTKTMKEIYQHIKNYEIIIEMINIYHKVIDWMKTNVLLFFEDTVEKLER